MIIARVALMSALCGALTVVPSWPEDHDAHADDARSVEDVVNNAGTGGGPCGVLPARHDCIRIGDPAGIVLATIGEVASSCTVHFTVTWGDGSSESHTLPPNSQLPLEHTYDLVGTYTATVDGILGQPSGSGCELIDWHRENVNHVIPRLRAAATLRDIDNAPLRYVSTDMHAYFGGNTRIHGTLTVTGAVHDELEFLLLEVSQGETRALALLGDDAQSKLVGVPFGADRKVSIDASQLLFELAASQAALFSRNLDGPVHLRVLGGAAGDDARVTTSLGDKPRLVRYKRNNRYGRRDPTQGGDDWVRPTVRPILQSLSIRFPALDYGDISNMNGGRFPPHRSHRDGIDVDVVFPGYPERDAAVARALIRHLNDPLNGSSIQSVFVTYNRPGGVVFPRRPNPDPFWLAIRNVILNDGRRARNVILPLGGHGGHFHWRINPQP